MISIFLAILLLGNVMLNLEFTGYIYDKWILLCLYIGRYSKENLATSYTLTSTKLGLSK